MYYTSTYVSQYVFAKFRFCSDSSNALPSSRQELSDAAKGAYAFRFADGLSHPTPIDREIVLVWENALAGAAHLPNRSRGGLVARSLQALSRPFTFVTNRVSPSPPSLRQAAASRTSLRKKTYYSTPHRQTSPRDVRRQACFFHAAYDTIGTLSALVRCMSCSRVWACEKLPDRLDARRYGSAAKARRFAVHPSVHAHDARSCLVIDLSQEAVIVAALSAPLAKLARYPTYLVILAIRSSILCNVQCRFCMKLCIN